MTPFGFGPPDDPNNENSGQNPENFDINEMMRQMQSEFQKISPQFGFMNPANLFGGMAGGAGSALPKDVIREVAKTDRKSTRLNSSHSQQSRMPSSA